MCSLGSNRSFGGFAHSDGSRHGALVEEACRVYEQLEEGQVTGIRTAVQELLQETFDWIFRPNFDASLPGNGLSYVESIFLLIHEHDDEADGNTGCIASTEDKDSGIVTQVKGLSCSDFEQGCSTSAGSTAEDSTESVWMDLKNPPKPKTLFIADLGECLRTVLLTSRLADPLPMYASIVLRVFAAVFLYWQGIDIDMRFSLLLAEMLGVTEIVNEEMETHSETCSAADDLSFLDGIVTDTRGNICAHSITSLIRTLLKEMFTFKQSLARALGLRNTAGSTFKDVSGVLLVPPKALVTRAAMCNYRPRRKATKLTTAGRALCKHAQRRNGLFWGVTSGSAEDKNAHAASVVDSIIYNCIWLNAHIVPFNEVSEDTTVWVVEARNELGYGVRWESSMSNTSVFRCKFRGFLEPHLCA